MENEEEDLQSPPPASTAPWLVFFDHEEDDQSQVSEEEEVQDCSQTSQADEEGEEDDEEEDDEEDDEEEDDCTQIFYSIPEGRSYVRHVKDLRRRHCWISNIQGWMIVHDLKSPSCFLFNPVTMLKLQLPPLQLAHTDDYSYYDYKLVLSSSPVGPDCCTIMFVDLKKRRLYLCKLKAENCISDWLSHDYYHQLDESNALLAFVVANKQLYGLTLENNLALIDTDPFPPQIKLLEIENSDRVPGKNCLATTFLESYGEMFLVTRYLFFGSHVGGDIRVCKMNLAMTRWEAVKSIGDRAFLCGYSRGWSCLASELGLNKNSIYYGECDGTELCVFDMAKGTVLMDQPCPNLRFPSFAPLLILPVFEEA